MAAFPAAAFVMDMAAGLFWLGFPVAAGFVMGVETGFFAFLAAFMGAGALFLCLPPAAEFVMGMNTPLPGAAIIVGMPAGLLRLGFPIAAGLVMGLMVGAEHPH